MRDLGHRGDRLTLTRREAAASLGVSIDFLDEHIAPHLQIVRIGRLRLIPVDELRRWVKSNAAFAVEPEGRQRCR